MNGHWQDTRLAVNSLSKFSLSVAVKFSLSVAVKFSLSVAVKFSLSVAVMKCKTLTLCLMPSQSLFKLVPFPILYI